MPEACAACSPDQSGNGKMRTPIAGFQIPAGGGKAEPLPPLPIRCLNIIGGGSQNKLLNQLTADALDIPVYAGPAEATAIGNILTQAMAKGEIADLQELREIVCKSIMPEIYYPKK